MRTVKSNQAIHEVVVVGGGFAGLAVARGLARSAVRVTVVDQRNYHLFQPLLYQVATAGLSPGNIASPIRALLSSAPNVEVHLGEVVSVDVGNKRVVLSNGALTYDTLVLAAGVRHGYFGHSEWERHAPGLKSLDDALEIRRRVLTAFEAAEIEADPETRRALLTFVVVGAGPTGVELAGALAELARFTLKRDFRAIDTSQARVVLVEAGPRILTAFPESLASHALRALKRLGVDVRLSTRVGDVNDRGVQVGAEFLPSKTVLWAAGVEAPSWVKTLGLPTDAAGRVNVGPTLNGAGHPEVFVVGDLAHALDENGRPLPGLAPVATQAGRATARNILRSVRGEPLVPFHYVDKGIMATIGRSAGIAQTGFLRLSGFIGWLAWLFVHLMFLVGFRNKLLVLIEWAWAYVTFGRGARLITGKDVRATKV